MQMLYNVAQKYYPPLLRLQDTEFIYPGQDLPALVCPCVYQSRRNTASIVQIG